MTVHVVTDSSSCVPRELADKVGLTILDLHTSGSGQERTTAGLGALELTATYARLLERGGDDGVVAIHISKELSATWSNAATSAAIFDGLVRVMDTNSVGMCNGYAALKAAEVAQAGGSLDEVARAAQKIIEDSNMWLYLHRLEMMRKGGRLSTGQTLLTTALAIKPILHLDEGRVALAAKTRTQAKAMDKLVEFVGAVTIKEAARAAAEGDAARSVRVAVHQNEAFESAEKLVAKIEAKVEQIRTAAAKHEGPFAIVEDKDGKDSGADKRSKDEKDAKGSKGTKDAKAKDKDSKAKKGAHKPPVEEPELASDLVAGKDFHPADVTVPEVDVTLLEISDVLTVHTGPGAIAVATVLW